ncbi:MAG: hypothetical protein M1820_001812 [Bogoriella megaspora]|nr:MAG: hypothetical protein M1820_001812 [Bogoriella megaspora]
MSSDNVFTGTQSLNTFKRQYFQLIDPDQISWPSNDLLKHPQSQSWLFIQLFDPDGVQYAPPERYQLRVLKQLVGKLEAAMTDPDEDEISEELVTLLSTLLSSQLPFEIQSAQKPSYVTYSYLNETGAAELEQRDVTILEARSVLSSSGTTGLRTWEAALHLGSFLTTSGAQRFVKGKNILELGAGTGFVSILCAKHLEARRVTASDGDPGTVEALNSNLFLNGLEGSEKVHPEALRWGRTLIGSVFEEEMSEHPYDTVLGADLTYDKKIIPSLISTISDLINRRSSLQVVIAATVRNKETVDAFTHGCTNRGLELHDLEFSPSAEEQERSFFYSLSTPIRIILISRKP